MQIITVTTLTCLALLGSAWLRRDRRLDTIPDHKPVDLANDNEDHRKFYQHMRRYAFSIIMTNTFGT
jgi:hypothetical protein